MKVSLIVPVLNEIKKVNSFLVMLQKMPGDWEILFADGGSTDGTLEHLKGKARVIACPKGRARQMNAAAREATGQMLWFVHCDSLLPQDAYRKIAAAVEGGAQFGCFTIGFDYDGPFRDATPIFLTAGPKRGGSLSATRASL